MNKTLFLELAHESLIFAQCRARACGISGLQVELWTISYPKTLTAAKP